MYPRLKSETSVEDLFTVCRDFYSNQPFVRVVEHIPATKHVAHTNFCDISVRMNCNQLVVFSATDNLIKGASGVAIQNYNLMLGLDQQTGLL